MAHFGGQARTEAEEGGGQGSLFCDAAALGFEHEAGEARRKRTAGHGLAGGGEEAARIDRAELCE
jgi:hypothetical protein